MPKKEPKSIFSDMYVPKNIQHNVGVVNFIGVFGALVAGLVAGIWGVTGWAGFLYYLAMQVVVTALLYMKTGGKVGAYFTSRSSIFFGEVLNSTLLLTFVLFWTLSHNYIHLF